MCEDEFTCIELAVSQNMHSFERSGVASLQIVEPRLVLAEGAIELPQIRLDPVQSRFNSIHAGT